MLTFLELGNYGRLGNQMFQIASTIGIAKELGLVAGFPKWKYNNLNQFSHIIPTNEYWAYDYVNYLEPSPYYDLPSLDKRMNWNLKGYFQSPKYFKNYHDLITKLFDFGERHLYPKTSIHIRRGDYVTLSNIHIDLSKTDYYKKALKLFSEDERFYVFSDDIDFAEEMLEPIIRYQNKDPLHFLISVEKDEWEAMKKMSECENHIIANSSFSWWASYLGINPMRRIIAPSKWVTNETHNDRLYNRMEIIDI